VPSSAGRADETKTVTISPLAALVGPPGQVAAEREIRRASGAEFATSISSAAGDRSDIGTGARSGSPPAPLTATTPTARAIAEAATMAVRRPPRRVTSRIR
jgi:hypothetical protein